MKRSEINRILREAEGFLGEHQFQLPPFAGWSPGEWAAKGPACAEIVRRGLGWDITDYGLGDFGKTGLFLFTIRNGGAAGDDARPYAEKILVVGEGQRTPTHFHWDKVEDIINRDGDAELVLRLWNSQGDDAKADTPVRVECDGVERELPAGGELVLGPGESVTLTRGLWHEFWARGGTCLVGEVSRVNDDATDNNFLEDVGRFPEIEEDAEPYRLLVGDYGKYYQHA